MTASGGSPSNPQLCWGLLIQLNNVQENGTLLLNSGANLTIHTPAFADNGDVFVYNGSDLHIAGALTIGSGTDHSASLVLASDRGVLTVSGVLTNEGTLEINGGSAVTFAERVIVTASRIVNANSSEGLDVSDAIVNSPLTNNGAVNAGGATVDFRDSVSGTGTFDLADQGGPYPSVLKFDSSVANTQSVNFFQSSSPGPQLADLVLTAGAATTFAASINRFAPGDEIVVKSSDFGTGTTLAFTENSGGTGGTLALTSGTNIADYSFVGFYTTHDFSISSTASGSVIKAVLET